MVATEILKTTPAIGHLVREGKSHQIYSHLQSGSEHGMHTMDQALAGLVKRGIVSYDEAREKASDLASFESLADRGQVDLQTGADVMSSAGMFFDDEFGAEGGGRRSRF